MRNKIQISVIAITLGLFSMPTVLFSQFDLLFSQIGHLEQLEMSCGFTEVLDQMKTIMDNG